MLVHGDPNIALPYVLIIRDDRHSRLPRRHNAIFECRSFISAGSRREARRRFSARVTRKRQAGRRGNARNRSRRRSERRAGLGCPDRAPLW